MAEPKIAFVVDALPGLGGSERVLMAALERFPSAPVYSLIYNRACFDATPLAGRDVRVSWVDRLPGASMYYRNYLPILPLAIRQLDLRGYDVVVSLHYAVAHLQFSRATVVGNQRTPNTRLQRTRCAPLRSPLSRRPFGDPGEGHTCGLP
jgi:hypothetical protein